MTTTVARRTVLRFALLGGSVLGSSGALAGAVASGRTPGGPSTTTRPGAAHWDEKLLWRYAGEFGGTHKGQ